MSRPSIGWGTEEVQPSLAATMLAGILFLAACSGDASSQSGSTTTTDRPPLPEACRLLDDSDVEEFVGQPVHPGSTSELVAGDSTCRWADADPAAPGHVLSLGVDRASSVDRRRPRETDNVYELGDFGDDAVGVQTAGGQAWVDFTASDVRIELTYDVVPSDRMPDTAIDGLISIARTVRAQVDER